MALDIGALFYYDSPKYITVQNKKLGFLYFGIIFVILAYIVAYVIVLNRGYQELDPLRGMIFVALAHCI